MAGPLTPDSPQVVAITGKQPAQPPPNTQTTVDNLTAASKSAPVDVKTAVALAHVTSDPSDTVENAQATAMIAKTARTANALNQLPREVQPEVHARLMSATGDQDLATRMGALGTPQPVAPVSKPGGLFHGILSGLDRARHDVAAAVNPAANLRGLEHPAGTLESAAGKSEHVLGDILRPAGAVIPSAARSATHQVLGALNSAAAIGPHAFRTVIALDEKGDPKFGQQSALAGIWDTIRTLGNTGGGVPLTVKNLKTAWQKTENGATTFDQNVVASMKAQYTPQAFKLIESIAEGGDPAQIAQQWGKNDPTLSKQVLAAVQQPEFQQAVTQLKNSQISFGHTLVGEKMLNDHPEQANLISGAADGLLDWYDNPIVLGSAIRKASTLARFSLDANDVQSAYARGGQIKNAMDYTAKAWNRGGADGVIQAFPELGKLVEDLKPIAKNAADNGRPLEGADIARWLSSEQGLIALTAGRAGRFFHGEVMIPHISALGKAAREGKVLMSKSINWAADDLPTIVKKLAPGYDNAATEVASSIPRVTASAAARVRRMGRLVPTSTAIADGDPNGILNFRRYANMFLPAKKASEWTNIFADADANGKYLATRGIASEIFDAMGRADNPDLDEFATAWLSASDDEFKNGQHFLANGQDRFGTGPTARPVGIDSDDMSTVWRLPDWKRIDALSKKTATLGALRVRVGSMADEALRIWRVGILGRLGFAERASGEELAGKLARNGASGVVRAYAARTSADVFHQVVETLPPEILAQIKSPEELQAAWYSFTRRAVKKGAAKVSGQDFMNSMKLFVDQGNGKDAFERWASSVHQAGQGYGDSMDMLTRFTTEGEGSTGVELRPGKDYVRIGNSDPFFLERYAMRLNSKRNGILSQVAFAHASEGVAAQRRAVLAFMQEDSPAMRDLRRLNPRSKMLPDERAAGTGGVTQQMVDRDWANKAVDQANELIMSPSGKPITIGRTGNLTLANRLLTDRIEPQVLKGIASKDLPLHTLGPEVQAYATNWYEKLLSGVMENFVGKPMDWLSRQPIFLDNYHMGVVGARKALARFTPETVTDASGVERTLTDEERTAHLDKLVNDVATERAINETLPYIHDVRSRTQFEVVHRRSAPFLFAQRQFYQRWMRNFIHSPQAIARMSTIMNGLRVSGFVHNDPQTGQAYFVYPGSGTLNNVVSHTLSGLGIAAYMNVPSSFTGEVSGLTPGLQGVLPSASPFLSVDLSALATIFPGVQSWANIASAGTADTNPNKLAALAGDIGSEITPSIISRIVSTLQGNSTGKGEMATAIMNAMAYLSAAGHGIPENATNTEKAKYVTSLKSTATSLLLTKAILGFAVPAAPQLNTDSLGLDKELLTLLNKMPYDQAILAFMAANPNATGYTIGKTGSVSGAEVPTTAPGLKFISDHIDFGKKYTSAFPWLIPQSAQKGVYDQAAENEQLLTGLRQQRDPVQDQGLISSWESELVYATDGTQYFNVEQQYLKASNAPGANYNADKAIWDKWSGDFLKSHPAFAEVKAAAVPAQRRTEVMSQMTEALKDPSLPKSPTTTSIKTMMDEFTSYQDAISNYSAGGVTLPGQGTNLYNDTNTFVNWGNAYAAEHPEAAPFWSGVLQYSVSW